VVAKWQQDSCVVKKKAVIKIVLVFILGRKNMADAWELATMSKI
jgi:hypothetical protein